MFPDYIDNTTREAAALCMMKAKRSFIDEIAPEARSVHLVAGGAFAKGLEVARRAYYENGLPAEAAIEAGIKALLAEYGDFQPPEQSYKTAKNMARALRYYFRVWPLGDDNAEPHILPPSGRRALELRFKVPIPGLVHPDHGGPIYYTGRPDMVIGPPLIAIEDDKTAGSLGESWRKQWDLDSASTGYVWAVRQAYGIETENVLIRGVSILKPKFKEVPISAEEAAAIPPGQVTQKYDKRGTERFYRLEHDMMSSFGHDAAYLYRPAWMVERWLRQLQRDLSRLIHAYLNNEWDYALHKGACNAYGGCPYKLLCESAEPEKWIPVHYVKRKWDPLADV